MTMKEKLPDTVTRRIAVILELGGSGQPLLDLLQPLLDIEGDTDLLGVFVEDDELLRAAALPFVQELCRLTFRVREFHSVEFERAVAMRTRSARLALDELTSRLGVPHTFRSVRGPAVNLLRDTAHSADITVFEPMWMFAAAQLSPSVHRRPQKRIVVAVDDLETGAEVLIAAALLAEGGSRRLSVLLTGPAVKELDALDSLITELLPAGPARIRIVPEPGVQSLIAETRLEGAGMLVLGATEERLKPESLRLLREQLRCPVCLISRREDTSE
jgi:hypothetical protein